MDFLLTLRLISNISFMSVIIIMSKLQIESSADELQENKDDEVMEMLELVKCWEGGRAV